MSISLQVVYLFLLALPVACIAWTVTHEEVFHEPRDYCAKRCKDGKSVAVRKFFYLFTCEYCFSHYVSAAILLLTGYKLVITDWRGYIISGFSLVWVANMYMGVFALIRQGISKEKMAVRLMEDCVENPATPASK